jgi:hypothetical protein
MGSFLSDPFFKSLSSTEHMFISIFMIQILHNITNSRIFSDIDRNCLLGNRKKIAKFLMKTFTCHSAFLYASTVLYYCSTLQRQFRLYIPFLGLARPQPQFPHSCVCERFIYSRDRSTYFLEQKRQLHPGNI